MPLAIRRLFFYVLTILFVIFTPGLIAYTAGYRYDFKQKRVVKVGAFSISTVPAEANLLIPGLHFTKKTPAFITGLFPGEYDLTLKKSGYHPWHKTLRIYSARTTLAHDIVLFRQSSPLILISSPAVYTRLRYFLAHPQALWSRERFQEIFTYPDQQQNATVVIDNQTQRRLAIISGTQALWRLDNHPALFTWSNNEVWQFDPETQKQTLITRLQEKIQTVIPLPYRQALLIILPDRVRALELDLRAQQNFWDLTRFETIQTASLAGDGNTLLIDGVYAGQAGIWALELQ